MIGVCLSCGKQGSCGGCWSVECLQVWDDRREEQQQQIKVCWCCVAMECCKGWRVVLVLMYGNKHSSSPQARPLDT